MTPAANTDGPEVRYAAFLADGRFLIQKCGQCGKYLFYPRIFCIGCQSDDLHWVEPAGTGTVYSTTTVRIDPANPHNVALVDLDEGIRMMTRIEEMDPDAVRIGMRVAARVVHGTPPMVTFVLAAGRP